MLYAIFLILVTMFNVENVNANSFAEALVADFEKSKCKNIYPASFGHNLPSSKKESCYIHDSVLYVEGIIGLHMIDALRENTVKLVVLNSAGGSTHMAKIAAKIIREKKIDTQVLQKGICASSCTLVYQAGINRLADTSSRFLYHCVVNKAKAQVYINQCGSDLMKLTDECQLLLEKTIEGSIAETKNHFLEYDKYSNFDLFNLLMTQETYPKWFETGNFCQKRSFIDTSILYEANVITDLQ